MWAAALATISCGGGKSGSSVNKDLAVLSRQKEENFQIAVIDPGGVASGHRRSHEILLRQKGPALGVG
jgi:hypothetical protein